MHIKLRLKWLVSAGLRGNCTTVPETTDCIHFAKSTEILVQMRIHMHFPFKLELVLFEGK